MTVTFKPVSSPPAAGEVRSVPEATLPQLFEAAVRAHPTAPALLSDETGVLTFAELNAKANRLAHLLIGLGAGPERVVGVALPRSPDAVVALVAVLKAGAVYLPLNPDYPAERLAAMVADADPVTVLTAAGVGFGSAPALEWDSLALGDFPDTDPADADRIAPLDPAHPLYLIYTSGSTGVPKGVAMPAASLVNLLAWHAGRFAVGPGTRTANLSAIGFDFAMHEILSALVHAKCLVVPAEDVRTDPIRLARWLDRHRVHQVFLPNVLIESLCEAAGVAGVALADLRDIIQSGEPLVLGETLRGFLRTHPGLRVHNHYGATEMQDATAWSSGRTEVPTIGTPLWNVRVHVLDDDLRPVPDGEPGDLYVAGAGLARGYLGRPGLTAERYLPDPFGAPGQRMYRTGDLARWNADGELECLGRQDNQVKINGFRVELGEIATRLRTLPGVRQALVLPRPAASGGKQLVAYVVGADLDVVAIRGELARTLPAHMVPAAVLALPELPVAPNGKVDLKALPSPAFATGRAEAETPEQQTLVDAFAAALGVPAGVDDDFLALGGDSLGAVRLVVLARRAGLALDTRQVFELGTPRKLAAAAAGAAAPAIPVRPLVALHHHQLNRLRAVHPDLTEILPVTPVQQGFLFHRLQETDSYTEQLRLELTGPVDARALRTAATSVLRRHAPLRAAFEVAGLPEPLQIIVGELEAPWRETDLSALDPAEARARADVLAARSQATPFDVRTPPLLRLHLVHLPGGAAHLLLDYHHLLLDGWSVTLLVRELLTPQETPAPPLRDWFRVLRARDREAAAAAWQSTLDGITPTVLAAPSTGSSESAHHVFDLPAPVTGRLVELARTDRLTLNTIVVALWGVVLAAETGGRPAVFGTTVSGRMADVPEVENLVAMLVNTVPVVVKVAPGEPARAFLRRVRAEQLALAPHEHLGLGTIRRLASWDAEFDTLLVFENPDLLLDDPRIADVRHSDDTHYALSLLVTPGETLRIAFTYRPHLIPETRVRRLADALTAHLTAVAEDGEKPVGT
ncbi:amino acid adenylation and condensation domain-containing protein [Amycolatopsis mediterranei S699]|uniref:Amino acid adenylation and condensation domain-containing protein n=3 Tax=Amycolatopsis mediterranei TaxID=33910 RepID=A0A0H3DEA8_AMYMU|nr:non-ribosomal peptide synthetase [Amycolatopsis mediterranei]ADJ47969.1 amino acid adenylation and condensation domain-containing protein [Amycolatopsis mediterranei U32]AEK44869.1 amino acid adenylation and condensation domain-containing protein [Amycolatopsis mediterranei S699]AFO79680.1 amino acid adenylation and condensation domain-containing protein [Amycolatopsis mediterranei S699]AGT86808.1 amino acid adenylation and condensation domain-containing protein [Amycolatopsis mediterranei R